MRALWVFLTFWMLLAEFAEATKEETQGSTVPLPLQVSQNHEISAGELITFLPSVRISPGFPPLDLPKIYQEMLGQGILTLKGLCFKPENFDEKNVHSQQCVIQTQRVFSEMVKKCTWLRKIVITDSGLKFIDKLTHFHDLGELVLTNNELVDMPIPNTKSKVKTRLTLLNLSGNSFEFFPRFPFVRTIKHLNMSNNKLTSFTCTLLPNLTYLDISNNPGLQTFNPDSFPNLETLCISHNQFTFPDFARFQKLQTLDAARNIPTPFFAFYAFSNLNYLSLADNGLTTLLPTCPLLGLTRLNLSCNLFAILPNFDFFPSLTNLDLRKNRLTDEAISFERSRGSSAPFPPYLLWLDLRENLFKVLPTREQFYPFCSSLIVLEVSPITHTSHPYAAQQTEYGDIQYNYAPPYNHVPYSQYTATNQPMLHSETASDSTEFESEGFSTARTSDRPIFGYTDSSPSDTETVNSFTFTAPMQQGEFYPWNTPPLPPSAQLVESVEWPDTLPKNTLNPQSFFQALTATL